VAALDEAIESVNKSEYGNGMAISTRSGPTVDPIAAEKTAEAWDFALVLKSSTILMIT
jgi:acyl-CoA reductase-like NAD-dependent aldehyde dehydrogenase